MHFQQHPHHQHHPHHQQHPGQGGYPGFQQGGPAGYPGQQMPPQMMGGGGFGGGFGSQQELVAFRSHHGQHMQALPDGSIKVANVGINDFERFTLEFLPDGAFYIRTPHGTYVNLEDNGSFRGVHTKHDRDSIFRFMPQPQRGPNHFALVTARGSYLQAPPGGSEWTKNSTNLGDWEVFEKISLGHAAGHMGQQMPGQQMPGQQMPGYQMPGQQMPGYQMPGQQMGFGSQERVAFRSHHGQQLQAHSDGSIKVVNCPINDWERFTLEYLPDGAFYIRTHHGTYVNLEDNGMFRGVHTKHDRDSIFRWFPQPQRGPNRFALATARGSYLQAPPGGNEHAKNSTNLGDWEIFEKINV